MTATPPDFPNEPEDPREDARWRAAWRATPAAPVPAEWQGKLMESLRERRAAAAAAPAVRGLWWGPLAAAAMLSIALGAAAALGVDPRHDLNELAFLAGDATAAVLHLPGAR
jgi:hypothetical protein